MNNHIQRQSNIFAEPQRTPPKDAETVSHKFLAQAGFINQLGSGIFTLLPLGLKVHKRIENIIRDELNALGAQEILMPSLQPRQVWEESGRFATIDPPLFVVKDRHEKELALAPTHEEVVTALARTYLNSYKKLPVSVYQIQTKFRNEQRSTGGLLRVREFIMKDLYSFHENEEDLIRFYDLVKEAYLKIFHRCGLEVIPIAAQSGTIGGKVSHEFSLVAPSGEDKVGVCENCGFAANQEVFGENKSCPNCGKPLTLKNCVENGHIFQLGAKYSQPMNATFASSTGDKIPFMMGCYGIGVGRLLAAIVEASHDENGIIWPSSVAPYDIHVISLNDNEYAMNLSKNLSDAGHSILFDDRVEASAGEKFADSELIGIPVQIILSARGAKEGIVEIRPRANLKNSTKVPRTGIEEIIKTVKNLLTAKNV